MKSNNSKIMTNSTTLNRRERNNSIEKVNYVMIAWICGFCAAVATAVYAMATLSSPIVFFAALAAAFWCSDPLRTYLRM